MSGRILAAVLGYPISQSLSPVIHEAAFRAAGRDGRYVAIECTESRIPEVLRSLQNDGAVGVSVTMPCKEVAADTCDELHPTAAVLRAVNCVSFSGGRTTGYNTDGDGCCDALREQAGAAIEGSRAVVLGAGGTARSVALALVRAGAGVVVVNRTASRADALVSMVSNIDGLQPLIRTGSFADVIEADIVVNTTSVGMGTHESPLDPVVLRSGQTVLDAVYHPLDTRLLSDARTAGATVVDGLWMLIHQARRQQEIWFGERPDAAPMREESERVLRHRAN